MTIAEKIHQLRKAKGMSLREFAELTGVTHTTINRLENLAKPTTNIFIDTLKTICKGVDYPFKTFLEETGYIEKEEQLTPYEHAKKLIKLLSNNELNALKGYIDALQESRSETDTPISKTN